MSTYDLCRECTVAAANDDLTSLDYSYTPEQAEQRAEVINAGLERLGFIAYVGEGADEGKCACCRSYTWNPLTVWK